MAERLIDLGNGFWNIRGDLRIGGLVNVGTQCSLVQLSSGRFLFLDSYGFGTDVARQVMALTEGGRAVEAILNLHPFHTLHCKAMHQMFPQAQLFGSNRHHRKWPDLPWQTDAVESPRVAARFPELRFSLPDGIDYICQNERVHAGSLLAYHPASGSLHVDDTLNVLPVPGLLRRLLRLPRVSFHPTMGQALQDRPGAAQDFRNWALRIADEWRDARTVCAAHSATLPIPPGSFPEHVRQALARVEPALKRAEAKGG
ncbi:hypothetical protein [Paracoccus benzoatiresistens]|uniref:MBL fold metallo-hydrolase n=1 Tax=Paracoccus benzoatiresistens TaxID=2997341 RepID=A0ABT4J772_9RHOB|nr:hypothetical protein [Paracoccus sp. EF6]MCZ0962291.1 hypothetical protein [Paracoccus sp. EF6]